MMHIVKIDNSDFRNQKVFGVHLLSSMIKSKAFSGHAVLQQLESEYAVENENGFLIDFEFSDLN